MFVNSLSAQEEYNVSQYINRRSTNNGVLLENHSVCV